MSYTECPFCTFGWDYDFDGSENWRNGDEVKLLCPSCENEYFVYVEWHLHFYGEHQQRSDHDRR